MAKQIINIGTKVNSGGGDPLRTAFTKTNENFTELYSRVLTAEGQLGISNLGGATIEQSIIGSVIGADSTVIVDYKTATITGKLVGDVTGSLFGDDSTILVDGVNSSINLAGTVKGDILPDTNLTYDIGSPTKRFKDIYLSSNTINLGGTALSVTGGKLQVGGTDVGNTISFSELTNKPTTVAGYGITDAFTNIGVGADDSTIRSISAGETFRILGGTSITTASDAEGNITITGVAQDFAFSSLTGKPTTIAGYGITDSLQLGTSATTALAGNTALFSGAYGDLTGKPTTVAGYGITDAFDGAFGSLSGKPTTLAGYGITDGLQLGTSSSTALAGDTALFSGAFADLTSKPTTIAGYGITDAFDGAFGSLSGKPNLFSTVASAGQNDIVADGTADKLYIEAGTGISIATDENTDTLTITATGSSSAADDITTGDAAVSISTTTGDITIDAQGSDTDIIFKGTDDASDITALTLDMSEAGKAIFKNNIQVGVAGHKIDFTGGTTTITATNNPLKLDANGGVQIQYGSSTKIATTSTGATITGTLNGHTIPGGTGTLALTSDITSASTAADDLTAGDAAVSIETTTGNITIDAQGNDTDIIFKGTDGGVDRTFLTMKGSTSTIEVDPNTSFKLVSDADPNKGVTFATTGSASGTTTFLQATGTVVLDSATQTLTNKTLTAPVISTISNTGTITLPTTTGTLLSTTNSDAPTTTTSSGDADFVLVDDGGTMKKITPANLGIGSGSTAADNITTGDAEVTIATSTGDITIDTQGIDNDINFKGTDDGSDITALTLDMSDAGKAIFKNGVKSTTAFPISAENGNVGISAIGGNVTLSGDTSDMTFTNTGSGIFSFSGDIKAKTSTGATLTLQTSDTALTSGDAYGKIDFQAPDEADGSASVLVGGGITLQSTGTSNNIKQYNEMQFRTSLGTQINQVGMTLQGDGDLTIAGGSLSSSTSGLFVIYHASADQTIMFRGAATGGIVTALELDMGNSGKAKFHGGVEVSGANIDFTNLPTSDPAVAGRLWRSGNDVKISTG